MIYVQDLKLEEDILPFYNFTNHPKSEEKLRDFLIELPGYKLAVLERQQIVKAIISNWEILENFTYRRLDLKEVHSRFLDIINRNFGPEESNLQSKAKLYFSETERNQIRSGLVQIVLLLSGLQRQYFARINKELFPENFHLQLQQAYSFLNKIRLERFDELIKEDRFSVSEISELSEILHQLDPKEITSFWNFFFTFEAYWSVAKATLQHGFVFPEFSEGNFRLEDFYHPAIKEPVKNSLALNADDNVMLLTGPNMSGKSTLLKAAGICVFLAHAGFSVPASVCKVPFFNSVVVALHLSDNLRDGYSHFMTEIINLKAVVQAAQPPQKCFAIFDEIFRGTNADDALEITQTTVNGLSKLKGSFFFVSTHLLQLEPLVQKPDIRKYFIECVLDKGQPRFSYKLKEGWSKLKIGRILFEKEGLQDLLGEPKKHI